MFMTTQSVIKSRVLKYAMELWGVKDAHDMDPVIDLLLDVFAFESYKLHEEIGRSDATLLHRLAGILVDSKWSLPLPSHALMSVFPNKGETIMLDAEDHFYAEKYIFGKDEVQVFFTPLYSHELQDVKVAAQITSGSISFSPDGKDVLSYKADLSTCVSSNTVWIALDIEKEILESLNNLTFCIIPGKWETLSFLKAATFRDCNDNLLSSVNGIKEKDVYGNAHYFSDIKDFYNDLYFNIDLEKAKLSKENIRNIISIANDYEGCDFDMEKSYVWIRMDLPEILDANVVEGLRILTNTFPIVNRKMVSQQHNFKVNGTIIPLYGNTGSCFLNIRYIQDDCGDLYVDRMSHPEEKPTGVFSLYFGDLERFDSSNAKSLIKRLIQAIREEGNAFAAMSPDTLTSQLKSLFEKINSIEKEMESHKNDSNSVKAFALTVPNPGATYGEIKYWSTIGETADNFPLGTVMHQFNMDKYDGSSIYTRTITQGGRIHINDIELIRSLRYGILSRNRIVSKEDIRSYIMHKLGDLADDVDIHEGVEISNNPKKGLVRVNEVNIRLKKTSYTKSLNCIPLSNIFEKELSRNSVMGSNYKVKFV